MSAIADEIPSPRRSFDSALRWLGGFIVMAMGMLILRSSIVEAPEDAQFACEDTHVASSLSRNDVNTALGLADAGDCVELPAGTANWTTTINFTSPANVWVYGAGDLDSGTGGGDATIIVDNVAANDALIEVTTDDDGYFRLSGITFRGGSGGIKEGGVLAFEGNSTELRVDHNTIDKSTYATEESTKLMYFGGLVRGVVDHNHFEWGDETQGWLHIVNGCEGVECKGDQVWNRATDFGTADFIYIEDNTGTADWVGGDPPLGNLTDCNTGGKYVARYNDFENANVSQTHPTGHAGDDRGCRAHEVYGNTVVSTQDHVGGDQPSFAFFYNNSGPALVWGNSVDGVYKQIIYVNNCRSLTGEDCGYTQPNPPDGWGDCGEPSDWDGNTGAGGYPCLDQPGRGQGDLIEGVFPDRYNVTLGPATIDWPRQALEPIYEWLTTGDIVSGWGGSWIVNNDDTTIVQNRDFYLHHGNASCNAGAGSCAAGVGTGTLAQRPANCTAGVAWWASDEGEWNSTNGATADGRLYKCTVTNTWTLYYTPYTYPHPLVN